MPKHSRRDEKNNKHIVTIVQRPLEETASSDCGACQVSCQSACKTSCTVGNQHCAKE